MPSRSGRQRATIPVLADLRLVAHGVRRLMTGRDLWTFGVLILIVSAISVRWLWTFRHGQPYDIDESGYLSIALSHYRGLFDGGLNGWWKSVLGPSVQAPLMTAATTPVFLLAGRNPSAALLVPLGFGTISMVATFFVGRRVGGRRVGWLAGLVAVGAPMLLSYSRSYNFAIAATGTLALALLAFALSDNLHHRSWSVGLGLFLGLTALARTMALAFLPAMLLAMAVAVASGPQRRRRAINGAMAVGVALAVAWPWYAANGSLVYDYLRSFGYGSRAIEYGTAQPFFSRAAWQVTAQYLAHSVYVPYVMIFLAGAVSLSIVAFWQVRRRGLAPFAVAAARSPVMPSTLLVVGGLAALNSSQNKGSAFVAPLVPAMAVCTAWALSRLPRRTRQVVTAVTVFIVGMNVIASSDLRVPLASPRYLVLPVLGRSPVLDGRGAIQLYEAHKGAILDTGAQPLSRQEGMDWVAATADTAVRIRAHGGAAVVTAFGFRHRLVNPNSVQLEELAVGAPPLPLLIVAPVVTTDTVDGYSGWLRSGEAAGACNLLTATGAFYEFAPAVTPATMEQAAEREGFRRATVWALPDGRLVSLWRRAALCP